MSDPLENGSEFDLAMRHFEECTELFCHPVAPCAIGKRLMIAAADAYKIHVSKKSRAGAEGSGGAA
jgi:hypothetical protein